MSVTPIYDPRAQRRVAAALAEEHRAGAAERRAAVEERRAAAVTAAETARAQTRLQWQAQAASLAADAADRDQARTLERRRATAAMRAERAAARRARWVARWVALQAGAPGMALDALWASVIVAPLVLTWNVQAAYAVTELGISPGMSWLFPLAIETGAWACAFEIRRRTRAGLPTGQLPVWMWVLAGVAATINLTHGLTTRGVAAGLALGALSVLGVLLHHVRSGLDAAAVDTDPADLRARARRFRAAVVRQAGRWVWHPVLSLRAASLSARAGLDLDGAWMASHRDRYGVDPDASRRDRRVGAVITRRATKADRKAARDDRFVIVSGQILALPPLPDTPGDPAGPATASSAPPELPADGSGTPAVRHEHPAPAITTTPDTTTPPAAVPAVVELHPRTAALLVKAREAIAAGELPARPSAHAIRKQFGGSSDHAAAVRDALNPTAAPTTPTTRKAPQ